jgi:hypothetical protein
MARNRDWTRPVVAARDYVCADAWTHDRPVDAQRFASTTGRPAIRVILDAELEFGEAERLMTQVLERLYGPEKSGEE